jgi:hypothetical protein
MVRRDGTRCRRAISKFFAPNIAAFLEALLHAHDLLLR